jgi:hypothetical protein
MAGKGFCRGNGCACIKRRTRHKRKEEQMKAKLAQMAMEMTPGERAMLKCGKVPASHMATIKAQGTELKSGDRKRPSKARAQTKTTTTPAARLPLTDSEHKAAVSMARKESIRAALEEEKREIRERELADARKAGKKMRERKAWAAEMAKREAAFAPVARAMDAAKRGTVADRAADAEADAAEARATGKPQAVHERPRVKAESEQDKQARAIYRKYQAMKAGKERTAYYKAKKRQIIRGAALEKGKK